MALGVTVDDLVERTTLQLFGTARGEYNELAANLGVGGTTFTLASAPDNLGKGAILAIDNEVMLVRSVAGNSVTVYRGFRGTTAAAHQAGDLVEQDPRFPRGEIFNMLREEIASWPNTLFKVAYRNLTFGANDDAVNLGVTTDIVPGRWNAWIQGDTDVEQWPILDQATIVSHQHPTYFGSGYSLTIPVPIGTTKTVRVAYGVPISVETWETDTDLEDVGLSRSMLDIPPLGVAARMLMTSEAIRSDRAFQADSVTAESVQPGTASRAGLQLWELRDRRLGQEHAKLLAELPYRG